MYQGQINSVKRQCWSCAPHRLTQRWLWQQLQPTPAKRP